jgi:cytochrome c oxidase subunit 1
MLWCVGFLTTFLFGGLTGVILASPPLDFHVSDSYFVVAHFHYVVFGTVVFAMFAGFYFWWPKMTGRMLDETLGKIHFWLLFVGFHTDVPDPALARGGGHAAPLRRLPAQRRVDHAQPGLDRGRVPARLSTLPFLWNVYKSAHGPRVMVDDPWGWGRSLEWATSCPPPRHNFVTIPRIRSESPAFDLHHPEIAALELMDNEEMREGNGGFEDAPATDGRAGLLRENLDAQGKDVADPNTDKRDQP